MHCFWLKNHFREKRLEYSNNCDVRNWTQLSTISKYFIFYYLIENLFIQVMRIRIEFIRFFFSCNLKKKSSSKLDKEYLVSFKGILVAITDWSWQTIVISWWSQVSHILLSLLRHSIRLIRFPTDEVKGKNEEWLSGFNYETEA